MNTIYINSKKERKKPVRSEDHNSETSDTVDFENNSEDANVSKGDDSEYSNETDQCYKDNENAIDDERFNVRALPKRAETYELEKFQKNALLIFNQINVDGFERPRHGTEKDIQALKTTFKRYGFEVKTYTDLTKREIFDKLNKFGKRDFTDYGCVGVAVLSHGSNCGMINAKDQMYSELEIIDVFNVHNKPTLVTKPKFLIQACRGMVKVQGVDVGKMWLNSSCEIELSAEHYTLPVDADILVLHSSYPRTPSYRDAQLGSWFVQSLCNKINELSASHDIESIMTVVKRDVAIEKEDEIYNTWTRRMEVHKQMPVMTSTLTRKLYFKKFGDPPFSQTSEGETK